MIEYIPKGTTITKNIYKNKISKLKTSIGEKRPYSFSQKTLLGQHLPYRPDLLTKLKKIPIGASFSPQDDLEVAVELYFAELSKEYFSNAWHYYRNVVISI